MNTDKDHLAVVSDSLHPHQLPSFIKQIQETSCSALEADLENLFNLCDDLFFDLSNRASNNTEQALYFETMRELRVKKAAVINRFKECYIQSFFNILNKTHTDSDAFSATEDSMALVQNDDLEEDVAIQSMTHRARIHYHDDLYQLTTRLNHVAQNTVITAENNALDPSNLCHCLAHACQILEIPIKAKIIVYKQFERHVLSKIQKIYNAANDLLIEAGILPRIQRKIKKNEQLSKVEISSLPSSSEGDTNSATQPSEFNYSFTELSYLLSSLKQLSGVLPKNVGNYTNNPGPLMTNQDLYVYLTEAQLNNDIRHSAQTIQEIVQNILSNYDKNKPRSLLQNDEDIINLVAMFFDFVLDDRNLPVAIQALISRLQIPILKTALKDKSFFNNANHPARKLVNLIASSSIGINWTEGDAKKDETIKVIQMIIHEINDHYRENDDIFTAQLNTLENFINKQQRNIDLIEHRSNQTAEGQARTQKAKHSAQTFLFDKLHAKELPATITSFIVNEWQQYLLYIHIKQGEDSAEWIAACQCVEDILWCCNQQKDQRAKERIERLIPSLMKQLIEGLLVVTSNQDICDQKAAEIQSVLEQLQTDNCSITRELLSDVNAAALGHIPDKENKHWKSLTALERQQIRYQQLTYEHIKKADNLLIGTWLAYEDAQKGKILRCKLSAKLSTTDTYLFVNRLGFKCLEKTRKELAYDMQQKRAIILDSRPIFDRAMTSIVDNIKRIGHSNNEQ